MLSGKIISWYLKNKRDLPWRKTSSPYQIWISEIMLQQTKVVTVIDYYNRFLKRFPDVKALALAKEQEVLRFWQGLGYYSRARNLHLTARDIYFNYNGKFPEEAGELIKFKGIGNYSAAAIAALAFNKAEVAIDGNVHRVLSRFFGEEVPLNTQIGKKIFHNLAMTMMEESEPATFNQALIELGALLCVRKPYCEKCPLQETCFALKHNRIANLPIKLKAPHKRNRFFYYLFLYYKNQFFLEKRTGNDIWMNMYQFPLIEQSRSLSYVELKKTKEWQNLLGTCNIKTGSISLPTMHKLSHQDICIVFLNIELNLNDFERFQNYYQVNITSVNEYPVPKPIEKYLLSHSIRKIISKI